MDLKPRLVVMDSLRASAKRAGRRNWFAWWVIVVGVITAVGAIVTLWNPSLGYLMRAAAPGTVIAIAMIEVIYTRNERNMEKALGPLPRTFTFTHGPEGRLLIVERVNGDITTLAVPDDYDPNDDNAQWLMDNLLDEKTRARFDFAIAPVPPDDDEYV